MPVKKATIPALSRYFDLRREKQPASLRGSAIAAPPPHPEIPAGRLAEDVPLYDKSFLMTNAPGASTAGAVLGEDGLYYIEVNATANALWCMFSDQALTAKNYVIVRFDRLNNGRTIFKEDTRFIGRTFKKFFITWPATAGVTFFFQWYTDPNPLVGPGVA